MMIRKGSVALITGGARGLGLAIAEQLGKAGAKLAIIDIDEEALNEGLKTLESNGFEAITVKCDVSNSLEVKNSIQEIIKHYGQIEILINNAAIAPNTDFLTCDEAIWDKVFAVNLKGYFLVAQTVAKHMIEKGIKGSIVNLSSILGLRPKAGLIAYTTTKGAILNMTYSMAAELGKYGIRVNAIAPGMIDTPMTQKGFANPMVKGMILGGISLGRLGLPEEVGKAAVFLCSDFASFVSGEVLIVDGGSYNLITSRGGGKKPASGGHGMPAQGPPHGH
ncbi:MAG: SDR family NAD(P)-dependent oxidoreductase [Candidatus Hodarchaeales archaeon]